ncbi:MAG: flagellar biosynthetic protein FliR [Chlamydiota bacterium]
MPSTDDYYSFFISLPHISFTSLITVFFLSLMRLVPIVALVSFLGSRLPGAVKMGLATSLSIIMLPHIMLTVTHPLDFNLTFLGLSLKEAFIGMIIGMLASIPFYIAEASGILIDYVRGSSSLQVQDPLLQTQTSPIGVLLNYLSVVIFFQLSGPFYFLNGIMESYSLIPIDTLIPSAFFSLAQPFWKTMLGLVNHFVAISIQIAAPALVAVLMAEMFLGIANRLAPQVQIAFLGMAFKSLLALALLWLGWFFILEQIGKLSLQWFQKIDFLIHTMKI